MKKYVIIVAGGSGQRFGSAIPKQFNNLINKPILAHTLNVFYEYDKSINIIVAMHADYIDLWQKLIFEYKIEIPHTVVKGGETRFHSVKNALSVINEADGLVAIHDAVRPLVDKDLIQRCFETAKNKGNAVPVIGIHDSMRKINYDDSIPVDRSQYVVIQTPQVFDLLQIKNAYNQEYNSLFTDDAIVYEKYGKKIILVEGQKENIKITTKTDLIIAETFMKEIEKK